MAAVWPRCGGRPKKISSGDTQDARTHLQEMASAPNPLDASIHRQPKASSWKAAGVEERVGARATSVCLH